MEILPYVWIGDKDNMTDDIFIKNNNIKCIINCTKNCPNSSVKHEYRIPLTRNYFDERNNILDHFEYANRIIDENIENSVPMLICCEEGKQVSPTIVGSYMIQFGRVEPEKIISCIQSKCADAFMPTPFFLESLEIFQKKL